MNDEWNIYWDRRNWFEKAIEWFKINFGYRWLLEGIPLGKPGKSLEVGAGKAYISRLLCQRGWFTSACDNNSDVVLRNAKYIDDYRFADAFKLPYANKQFDLVFCCGLLEHYSISEAVDIIRGMQRVGKKVVIWVPSCSYAWKLFWKFRRVPSGDNLDLRYAGFKRVVIRFSIFSYVCYYT